VGNAQAPGALGGLSQPVSGALAGTAGVLGTTSSILDNGLARSGATGAAPITDTVKGVPGLVDSAAAPIAALGTGGLSGLAPVTTAVATTVTNVGNGVGGVVNSPSIAPVTKTVDTLVNNVAAATGISSTTGNGSGGANADPLSALAAKLRDLGQKNRGL